MCIRDRCWVCLVALVLSQEELAARAEVHRTYIGMIERAEKNITLVNIEKIAHALEIKIKDLFDELKWTPCRGQNDVKISKIIESRCVLL